MPDPHSQMEMIKTTMAHPEKFKPRLDVSRLESLLEAWKVAASAQSKDACLDALLIYGLTTVPKNSIEQAFLEQLSNYCIRKYEKISNVSKKKSIKESHSEEDLWTVLESVHRCARNLNSFRKFIVASPMIEEPFIIIELDDLNSSYENDYKLLKDKYDIYYDVSIKPEQTQ